MKTKVVVTVIVLVLLAFLLFIMLRDLIPERPLKNLPEADMIVIREYRESGSSYVDYEITDPETVESARKTLSAMKVRKAPSRRKKIPASFPIIGVSFYKEDRPVGEFTVSSRNASLCSFDVADYLRSLLPDEEGE